MYGRRSSAALPVGGGSQNTSQKVQKAKAWTTAPAFYQRCGEESLADGNAGGDLLLSVPEGLPEPE